MATSDISIQIKVCAKAILESFRKISLASLRRQYGWRRFFVKDWWYLVIQGWLFSKKEGR
jgi:hypothetical protein